MKLHPTHFRPHGLVRAYSHLVAGRRLCRAAGMSLRPLVPVSVNSMTAAYNVFQTLRGANLPSPSTFVDVGANVSQMTRLLLALNPDARVVSFEPNPKLSPMGDVHRIALSDSNGTADFFLPSDDSDWGTLVAGKSEISSATSRQTVETRRMDSLIESGVVPWTALPRPLFVKIDTEGSEKRVLEGFGKYLDDVSFLLVEVENVEQRGQNYDWLSLCPLISARGFNRCKIVYSCYDGPDAPAYSDVLFWKA